jgi:hypothetical protein
MTLSKREKVIVSSGLVVALLLLFKLLVFPVLEKGESLDEPIEAKRALLMRYRKTLNEKHLVESKLAETVELVDRLEGSLLRGSTVTLASATLQSRLEKMARKRKLKVKSIKTISPKELGYYTRVGVEITFNSTIASLRDILYDLEGKGEGLSVTLMEIHLQDSGGDKGLKSILRVEGLTVGSGDESTSKGMEKQAKGHKWQRSL